MPGGLVSHVHRLSCSACTLPLRTLSPACTVIHLITRFSYACAATPRNLCCVPALPVKMPAHIVSPFKVLILVGHHGWAFNRQTCHLLGIRLPMAHWVLEHPRWVHQVVSLGAPLRLCLRCGYLIRCVPSIFSALPERLFLFLDLHTLWNSEQGGF